MRIIPFIPLLLIHLSFSACQKDGITWKSEHLEIHVTPSGYVDKLIQTENGTDWAISRQTSPLLQVRLNNEWIQPRSMEAVEYNLYRLNFGENGLGADIRITENPKYIRMEVVALHEADDVEVLLWGPFQSRISETIGEIVGVVRNDEFAIGLQALNIRTLGGYPSHENDQDTSYDIFETNSIVDVADSVKVLYRGQTARRTESGSVIQAYVRDRSQTRIIPNWNHEKYVAPAFEDPGLTGTAIALFGCRPEEALAFIGEIEQTEGLPHPVLDGKWAKVHPEATASYLIMNFGETTLDNAMALTKKAGLKYLYHGGPFLNWGHFDLNPDEFPDNWESMRRCVQRAEEQGLRLGVHTLSNFITTNDPYVSPIPDPRLAIVGSSTVSRDIGEQTRNIEIDEPDFFNQMKNNTLQSVMIGNEIIRYRAVSTEAPWTLLDCERGAYGTQASAHAAGSEISKLMDHGYRVFLTNAELSREVALRLASLYNQTGLRQISFDGLEGNWSTGMGQYGRQLFVQYWYDALKPDLQGQVITDASNPGHFFWHSYTRMNWGEPWYAGFRESQTQYRLLNQDFYQRNLMPSMLGWFRMTPQISLEDMEWLLARAAGFDAGFALVTSKEVVEAHGMGDRILQTISMWEEARLAGVFPEELKKDLQDINQEFTLMESGPERWHLHQAKLVKAIYPYTEKQPGEPHLLRLSFLNENPDQPVSFVLSSPKETGLADIQLEIDQFRRILLPLNLPPGHHLRYTGGSYVSLYDETWHEVSRSRIIQDHLVLTQGEHSIQIEGRFTSPEGAIKAEFRTLSPEILLTK